MRYLCWESDRVDYPDSHGTQVDAVSPSKAAVAYARDADASSSGEREFDLDGIRVFVRDTHTGQVTAWMVDSEVVRDFWVRGSAELPPRRDDHAPHFPVPYIDGCKACADNVLHGRQTQDFVLPQEDDARSIDDLIEEGES